MIARFAAMVALALALVACKREGAPYACECDMLTDYDDAHRASVKVCAASVESAASIAEGCAQLADPMPVQRCSCRAETSAPSAPACREGCLATPASPEGR